MRAPIATLALVAGEPASPLPPQAASNSDKLSGRPIFKRCLYGTLFISIPLIFVTGTTLKNGFSCGDAGTLPSPIFPTTDDANMTLIMFDHQ
jgi:hypothetical protein